MSMDSRWYSGVRRPSWGALIRTTAWLMVVGVTGLLVRAEANRPVLPEGVVLRADLTYRNVDGRKARLDLYLPASPAPPGGRPAIVAIHGGGWRGGTKSEYGPHVARLAQYGYVVAAVDYRLSRPGRPSWPDNLEDVREAVRWIRRHAGDYGVDPSRVAALGASAGGHLAALLGTWPEGPGGDSSASRTNGARAGNRTTSRVQAVVDFYGPSDLSALKASRPISATPVDLMLTGGNRPAPEQIREASPVTHVSPGDPPTLLIHGIDDAHVPVAQSESLAAALKRSGVAHRLILVEGARHGFVFSAGGRDLLPEILAFLRSTLSDPAQSSAH